MSVWDALTTRQIARIFFTTALFAGLLFLLVQVRSTLMLLAIAVFLAAKFFKESSPPTPDMAIDEAGKIKKTLMFRRKKKR